MTAFTAHQVLSEYKGIGDQLRFTRLQKDLSVEEVARFLKVKPEYVYALEDEDYALLPGGIYGKIFLKKYVNFLGLDYKKIVKSFVKERRIYASEDDDVFSKKVIKRRKLIIFPKVFRNLLIVLAIVTCVLYLGFYLKKITAAPHLAIITPAGNLVQSELNVDILGETEPESEVAINGQTVLIDKDGKFFQKIALKRGVNIIVVKAKKKYSREQVVTRQILVE
ncbi:MAG: helix-turn-helix domain-containing protein [Patescibacteria group bacterium]